MYYAILSNFITFIELHKIQLHFHQQKFIKKHQNKQIYYSHVTTDLRAKVEQGIGMERLELVENVINY